MQQPELHREPTPYLLVVDDDEAIRDVIQSILEFQGLSGFLFGDADAAERHLSGCSVLPSLMLLDLNIPGVSGIDFLSKLKSHPTWSGIPVMIFSASSDISAQDLPEGVRFLRKPFELSKFINIIDEYLKPPNAS